ncbi:hypothetical protein R3P38DRAFT_3376577 [Favolaschia claudopus]|uniref:Uncharacterized protein n=1 Tax=Favolaschia claudopus TaxID=2862362 RepID=A0AAV9ZFS6_9AGAR
MGWGWGWGFGCGRGYGGGGGGDEEGDEVDGRENGDEGRRACLPVPTSAPLVCVVPQRARNLHHRRRRTFLRKQREPMDGGLLDARDRRREFGDGEGGGWRRRRGDASSYSFARTLTSTGWWSRRRGGREVSICERGKGVTDCGDRDVRACEGCRGGGGEGMVGGCDEAGAACSDGVARTMECMEREECGRVFEAGRERPAVKRDNSGCSCAGIGWSVKTRMRSAHLPGTLAAVVGGCVASPASSGLVLPRLVLGPPHPLPSLHRTSAIRSRAWGGIDCSHSTRESRPTWGRSIDERQESGVDLKGSALQLTMHSQPTHLTASSMSEVSTRALGSILAGGFGDDMARGMETCRDVVSEVGGEESEEASVDSSFLKVPEIVL